MRPAPESTLSTPVLAWVSAAVFIAALPHAGHLPAWVSALIPAAILLRLGLGRPLGRWLLIGLVATAVAAVFAWFQTIAGITAGGGFLVAMVALKLLETRNTRDAGLLLCLAYFLATSIFLVSQSIAMAAYVLLSVAVTTFVLMTLAAPAGPSGWRRARMTGSLLLQAIPIMLVLFVLFPRLPGPLWGVGQPQNTASTGLSDTMSPGSITRLTRSSAVAFRVQFEGEPPPPAQLYWRGPVLWHYDGRTWSRGEPRTRERAEVTAVGQIVEYTVLLQPHGQPWLLALDLPLDVNREHERTAGLTLMAAEPVESVIRYQARSALEYRFESELPPARRQRALALPPAAAPLARQLARRWRVAASGPREIVERALRYFHENGFEYTLSPPPLGAAPVDDFLFRTKSGFCEHYASAFAVLMRAAGIPTRVVTGYLGGEFNELGDYWIVRQSDAHAWTEVWLPDSGWTRVDPTRAVARQRIELGIASLPQAARSLPFLSYSDGWVKQLALVWDSVNRAWYRLVLGYGPKLQERFLSRLGLGHLGRYALALVMIAAVGGAVTGLSLLMRRRHAPADPAMRAWCRATARLSRAGIAADPHEGPRAFAARVRRERPDLAAAFGRIARTYIALRYRVQPPPDGLRRLQREVRHFRPRRRARKNRKHRHH